MLAADPGHHHERWPSSQDRRFAAALGGARPPVTRTRTSDIARRDRRGVAYRRVPDAQQELAARTCEATRDRADGQVGMIQTIAAPHSTLLSAETTRRGDARAVSEC